MALHHARRIRAYFSAAPLRVKPWRAWQGSSVHRRSRSSGRSAPPPRRGSLGRAALRLSVSQPALTKRLNGLEQLAGVQLLERTSRGVALTPAGRRLYGEASRLMEHVALVEAVILGLRTSTPPIRLAASHSATEAFVASALAPVTGGNAPTVELITANSHVVRRLVADGTAEIGVAAGRPSATPSPAVHRTQIAEDAIVCAVPRGHRWAQRKRITQQDLAPARRWCSATRAPTPAGPSRPSSAGAGSSSPRRSSRPRPRPRHCARRSPAMPRSCSRGTFSTRRRSSPWTSTGCAFPRAYELVLPALGSRRRRSGG